jgi:hypothetical protein
MLRLMLKRICVVAVALTVGAAPAAYGQRFPDALVGTRVRIETAAGSRVTGTVVSVDADTVRLVSNRTAGSPLALPRATVVSYEVSSGREVGRGARRGALVGGALGIAVIVASLRNDTMTVNRPSIDLRRSVPVSLGLVALGAGLGAALAPEQWESATRIAARARVRIGACPGRCVALGYRY